MRDRIIEIMEHEKMTQAQFATLINIQRAAMSHIISGRNNPSLDVVQKILMAFPSINPDWLLHGKGEMFRGGSPQSDLFASATMPQQIKILKEEPANTPPNSNITESLRQEEKETAVAAPVKVISKIMVFYSDNTYETFLPDRPVS